MGKETLRTHKDLDVWKHAMQLAAEVYSVTAQFPKEEMYGLVQQARRSAVSVPSNIAEGAARNSRKEFLQLLYVALGSLAELETQVLLAKRIGYADGGDLLSQVEQVRKRLLGLIRALKKRQSDG